MSRKVFIIADPGIDGAFALALALHDPELDIVGLAATAGNVGFEQATKNIQILLGQMDPPRWPRLAAAIPVEYGIDGSRLHGPTGFGTMNFPLAQLHHLAPADRLLSNVARQYPNELTVVVLGPLTVLARALDRDPELPGLLQRLVCVGGTWHDPGNATAVAEFHFFCDPQAARQVVRAGVPMSLIPLDVSRKLVLSPADLLELAGVESSTCQFLRQIVPYGIRMSSNLYGIEGFHLKDVLGIAAVTLPDSITTRPVKADVETRGELTRGMLVVDTRQNRKESANIDLAVNVDVPKVRLYMQRILSMTS